MITHDCDTSLMLEIARAECSGHNESPGQLGLYTVGLLSRVKVRVQGRILLNHLRSAVPFGLYKPQGFLDFAEALE